MGLLGHRLPPERATTAGLATPVSPRRYTVNEYLKLERTSMMRSEYLDGVIYERMGSSYAHIHVAGNISTAIRLATARQACEVFLFDMRVRVADTGLFAYPDVLVACPPIAWDLEHMDMLENPVVLVEVLSPSTELYDRNEKWARYQQLPSLQHYLLVAQNRVQVDHLRRDGDGWRIETLTDLDSAVRIEAIDVTLQLRDVYERVLDGSA